MRVADDESPGREFQRAGVPDLTAGFGIERRALENDRGGFARRQRFDTAAFAQDRDDLAVVSVQHFVAKELRWLQFAGELRRHLQLAFELAGRTRTLALLVHGALEAAHVHRSEERRVGKECRSRGSPYQ